MKEWTAVVLATSPGQPAADRPIQLGWVAGLSVLSRVAKSAKHEGATRLVLVVSSGSELLIEEARSAWGKSDGFKVIEVTDYSADTDTLKTAMSTDLGNPVVMYADLSFSRNLLQALLQQDKNGFDGWVAVGKAERWRPADYHESMAETRFSGMAWLTADLARSLPSGLSLSAGLNQVMHTYRVGFRRMENSFSLRVRNPEDLQRAEKMQIRSLRRNTDGLVSQYLNRPVSLWLCQHVFLPLRLRPNHITILAAAIGWAGIGLVASWPGYAWVLLGSLLFHVSSILDGCDGEIARLKFQFSRFGEWLDNVLDEINNTAFIASIGLGAYLKGGPPILAWAAGFYGLAVAVCDSAAFYQLATWRGGSGNVDKFRWFFEEELTGTPTNPTAYPARRTLAAWLKELPRRDFYIFFFFLLAIADVLLVGFWIAVVMGVALFLLGSLQWYYQIRHYPRRIKTYNQPSTGGGT